jgi:hypothetical protein
VKVRVKGIRLLILDTDRLPSDEEEDNARGRPAPAPVVVAYCERSPNVFRGEICAKVCVVVVAGGVREPDGLASGLSGEFIWKERGGKKKSDRKEKRNGSQGGSREVDYVAVICI